MKKKRKKLGRKLLSFLLTLAMVVGMMPGMGLTAYADNTEKLLTTITPTGKTTYSETTSGVVTVSHNNDYYNGTYGWLWYEIADTLTVSGCEGYTITKVIFKQYPDRTVTDSSASFELHFVQGRRGVECQENSGMDGVTSIEVYGYANKTAQTITAEDVTVTYGDTDKSVSATVTEPTTGGGAISYTVKDGSGDYIDVASDGKLTIKKVPASGKAYVIVKAAETDDYAETTKEVTVTISKAEATVAAKDQGIMVGGTVPDLSAPVLNTHYSVTGLVGTDALTTAPTLAYQKNGSAATPDNTVTGTYDIVASGASADDNYNISYTKGALTISEKQPATVTKVPTAKTLTYTGSAQALVTAGTATGGTMQYALGNDAATVPTDGWSEAIPTGTDAGTYYVWYKVVGDENHVDTKPVMLKAVIENVDQGEAEIKTEVRTDENSPEVKPSNLTKELAESTLSSEEKAVIENAINNGEDVKVDVYLAIKDISDTISASDQEKVKAAATDADKIEFFDISLFKEISISGQSRGATSIHDLTTPLKLTIGVPKSFPAVDDGYTRTYVVLRLHEGSVTVLPTTLNADGTLSFETDKFSTYALAYTDTKEKVEETTTTATTTEETTAAASTSDATTAVAATAAAKTSPKTGDSMPIAVLVVLMFAAAGMLVFMDLKKKKN